MENIERLVIDFNGYIEIDKKDIIITEIDEKSGEMKPVDVSNLTKEQIIQGVENGNYFVSLEKCFEHALDGFNDISVSDEEEDEEECFEFGK